MRTTIDILPEAWHLAKAIARERHESLGKVISDFILRAPAPETTRHGRSVAGFPVFTSGKPITAEEVQSLLDEDAADESPREHRF